MSRMIGKKRRLYSQASLIEAAKLVEDNELSLNKAAKVFGIPKTSLHDKVCPREAGWYCRYRRRLLLLCLVSGVLLLSLYQFNPAPVPRRYHKRLKLQGVNHDNVPYKDYVIRSEHVLREDRVTHTDHVIHTDNIDDKKHGLNSDNVENTVEGPNSDNEANTDDEPNSDYADIYDGQNVDYEPYTDNGPNSGQVATTEDSPNLDDTGNGQTSDYVDNADDEPNSDNIDYANDKPNSDNVANIEHMAHARRDLKVHEKQRVKGTTSSTLDVTRESMEQNNIHDKAVEEKRTITLLKKQNVVEKAALLAKAINDYRAKTANGARDGKDVSDTYNMTVSREYIKQFFSAIKPVQNISCKLLFDQDSAETGKAYMKMITNRRRKITSEEYINMTKNCNTFIKQRHYFNSSFNTVEQNFPLAYSIVAYRHVEQIERLLRLIYRPQNFYCIHMDVKSSDVDLAAVRAITSCFPNVVMPATAVSVKWGKFSVLEAELVCLEALWRFPGWRYFINLTGQELPLKTNLELVKILQAMKGANLAGGSRNRVRYVNYRRYSYAGKPPHGIQVVKGPVHVVINRQFADFVLHDNRSRDFLEWLKDTGVPDESFFSTLNHNTHLGIPGSFLGDPEEYPEKPMITRYKNWRWPNGNWNRPCAGKYVHAICITGVADLHRLANTLGLFVNKVQLNYEHMTFDCLEEMIVNRTRDQYWALQPVDLAVYQRLDQVKLRLKEETLN